MKRLLLFLLAFGLLAPAAMAEEWSKTFTLTGKPDLRVETSDADIRVDTWDQNTIGAKVTTERWKIGDDGIKIIDRQNGNSVELEVRFPHRNFVFDIGRRSVIIDIHMPREGQVRLHTNDGHIELRNLKGDLDLSSGDGHLDIDGVDGSLRARTGDGSIRANGRFDHLTLDTSDGRIETTVLPGSTLGSAWDVHTGDGSVTLRLPDNLAADVDLRTGDGRIHLDMPITVQGGISDHNVRGKLNGGGNLLAVRTGDGSIRLEK